MRTWKMYLFYLARLKVLRKKEKTHTGGQVVASPKKTYLWASQDVGGQRRQTERNCFHHFRIRSTQKAVPGACIYLETVYMLQNSKIWSLGRNQTAAANKADGN